MSVEDLSRVDLVSLGPDGRWFVTVLDEREWMDSVQHQYALQRKLNRYMAFLESGEFYEQFPKANGEALVIDVRFLHMPDEEGWKFLERVRLVVERAGFQFECKMINGVAS